jgi:hypothetical protein
MRQILVISSHPYGAYAVGGKRRQRASLREGGFSGPRGDCAHGLGASSWDKLSPHANYMYAEMYTQPPPRPESRSVRHRADCMDCGVDTGFETGNSHTAMPMLQLW